MKDLIILSGDSNQDLVDKVNKATNESYTKEFTTSDSVLQLLGLCLLLIIILTAAYYTTKFVGRYKLGQLRNSNIQVIEAYRISPNKIIQIVKIANKYLVLGIGKDNISYITELDESEVITHENSEVEKQSFRQIFERIKGKKE